MRQRISRYGWLCFAGLFCCNAYDDRLIETWTPQAVQVGDAGNLPSPPPTAAIPPDVSPPPLPEVATRCGDGVISGPEKCDVAIGAELPGACPSACPPLGACARRVLNGTACQAECLLLEPSCIDGDDCCPGNCMPQNDADCSTVCGDGKIEAAFGETCEPGVRPCEQSDADCADDDPCTIDTLSGGPGNCNSSCLHQVFAERVAGDGCCPVDANANLDADCAPRCGNGVREPGEDCDGGEGCDDSCNIAQTPEQLSCLRDHAATECQRCSCLLCTAEYMACQAGPNAAENALCRAVVECTERDACEGALCYCSGPPPCSSPPGPCRAEIEAAAGTRLPPAVTTARNDPNNPLGRASLADDCRRERCSEVCTPPTESFWSR